MDLCVVFVVFVLQLSHKVAQRMHKKHKAINHFLTLKLSNTTAAKISEPPIKVFISGISDKKKNAMMIPKTGCKLLIMLVVVAEKNFNECNNIL